jgi:hypothetical protein
MSQIIKTHGQQSSKNIVNDRQQNMVKHRQQTWPTIIKTQYQKSSKNIDAKQYTMSNSMPTGKTHAQERRARHLMRPKCNSTMNSTRDAQLALFC